MICPGAGSSLVASYVLWSAVTSFGRAPSTGERSSLTVAGRRLSEGRTSFGTQSGPGAW